MPVGRGASGSLLVLTWSSPGPLLTPGPLLVLPRPPPGPLLAPPGPLTPLLALSWPPAGPRTPRAQSPGAARGRPGAAPALAKAPPAPREPSDPTEGPTDFRTERDPPERGPKEVRQESPRPSHARPPEPRAGGLTLLCKRPAIGTRATAPVPEGQREGQSEGQREGQSDGQWAP